MKRSSSIWPGVVLIVLGVIFLIDRLNLFYLDWSVIWPSLIILLGIYFFARTTRDAGSVFAGTLFFFSGLAFLARNEGWFYTYVNFGFGGILLAILGLAFLALFVVRPEDWGVLIPAVFFIFLGGIIWADQTGLISWYTRHEILRLWPVLLILIGVGIIISALVSNNNEKSPGNNLPDRPESD